MSAMPFPHSPSPHASAQVPGLPAGELRPILGREREIEAVLDLLDRDDIRIVTLLGPGGVGKTRLAQEVAKTIGQDFAHGAVFVPLAAIRNPHDVPDAVARSLGLEGAPGSTPEDLLAAFLADRHLLLVLDNLEQVIASAGWVSALAAGAPRTKMLLTSRMPLRVQGEQQFVVPPLPVPNEEGTSSAAVMLFVQRATAVSHEFHVDTQVARVIAGICRELDGLPLAIELAAARMKILSPDALLARLTDRLSVLTGGQRDVPPRLRSMRDAIAWSYELLSPEEQHLFRRLAVFLGGFTLEAADFVGSWPETTGPEPPVLDVLQSLVDQSLIQRLPGHATRFGMLETIREYGYLELGDVQEADTAQDAHAGYFLQLGQRAEEALTGPLQAEWLELLEKEHANIRQAVTWLESHGRVEDAIELVQHISFFLLLRGHIRETLDRCERWLLLPELAGRTRSRGLALLTTGGFLQNVPDLAGAREMLKEATEILLEMGDRPHAAKALGILTSTLSMSGDFERMSEVAERAIELAMPLNLHRIVSTSLSFLALAAETTGNAARGRALREQSYEVSRAGGDLWVQAFDLADFTDHAVHEGDLASAEQIAREHLALLEKLGTLRELPAGWGMLAWIARLRGDVESATSHVARALDIAEANEYFLWLVPLLALKANLDAERGDIASAVEALRRAIRSERHWEPEFDSALCLGTCAQIAMQADDPEAAARFLGALSTNPNASGPRMQMDWYDIVALSMQQRGPVRARLGAATYDRAFAAGARLSREEALEEALRYTPSPVVSNPEPSDQARDLSAREREVLVHMANGLSNQQIADLLFLSLRTVTTHATHIMTKLDVQSRTAAVSFAIRNGLA